MDQVHQMRTNLVIMFLCFVTAAFITIHVVFHGNNYDEYYIYRVLNMYLYVI
jgi:hypothetical protein